MTLNIDPTVDDNLDKLHSCLPLNSGKSYHQAPGFRAFKKTFLEKQKIFTKLIRHLAHGRAPHPSYRGDWIGNGLLTSGFVVLNGIIGALSIVGILTGFVTLGVGLGLSFLGGMGGIAFNYYRYETKKKLFQRAHHFNVKKIERNIDFLADKIMLHFADKLNHCSPKQAKEFATKVHEIIVSAIVLDKVQSVRSLLSPTYLKQYEAKWNKISKPTTLELIKAFFGIKNAKKPTEPVRKKSKILPSKMNSRSDSFFSPKPSSVVVAREDDVSIMAHGSRFV
jgi:transposase-like protein